jgi:predicted dehydrogenase
MLAKNGPTQLVAMADVFSDHLNSSYKSLTQSSFAKQIDVPDDRKFVGFDAYKKAMDCLRPRDVVILATPPAFRWVQFTYAIEKGINVFMEKPIAVDGPSVRKMLKLEEQSQKKNLKVGVGLMCRHCAARHELFDRIKSGQLGDITLLRAYRQKGREAKEFSERWNPSDGISELLYQIKRFHSFLWASGGCYSDFLIHNIDECCWMKDDFPIEARASGGRLYRDLPGQKSKGGRFVDQNFDHYSVEYTFRDGAKLLLEGRNIEGCDQQFASYAHGTKGAAVISTASHTPARCKIYKSQNLKHKDDVVWQFPSEEPNPYQVEWDDLLYAIRQDRPYNEVKRGAEASLVTAMGRMAAHTGKTITREQMLNCEHEFAPDVDKFVMDSPPPITADKDGKYPVPRPGRNRRTEF